MPLVAKLTAAQLNRGMTFRTCVSLALVYVAALCGAAADIGEFSAATDVGNPKRAGTTVFDPAKRTYTISGGGKNMWGTNDAFHFVWKKVSGDVTLTADVAFVGTSKEPHRKACLLIRQSLDVDSAYADVVLHGDGSSGLQFRQRKGDITRSIPGKTNAPVRLQIQYTGGSKVRSWLGDESTQLAPAAFINVQKFTEPFYIGLGVCSHNDDELETAVFSNVKITQGAKR
jgi:TolB protein